MSSKKIWYSPNSFESYGQDEIDAVVSCLKRGWLAGFGPVTKEFENIVAKYFGKKYGLFVNSGSSANILALCSLDLNKNDEIITPACTFATTVSPILQLGFKPVFCDVGTNTYVPDINQIIENITDKTRVIMIPNLIGNKPNWSILKNYLINNKLNIILLEDSCDTITTTVDTDISTTSFYASHMITAGGMGGMVMFNDEKHLKRATMFRDWGRMGDNSEETSERFNYDIDGILYDWKFLYGVLGYNFKSCEMSAAFGLEQFKKLDSIKIKRRLLFDRYMSNLKGSEYILPNDEQKSDWLAIPLQCKGNRKELLIFLEENNVQTRVCFSGNITRHIPYIEYKADFTNSDNVMKYGFLLGCHQGMSIEDVDRVCNLLLYYNPL
jgi:CDP-6-deoxy-D-xylo-4-hexulose-3-dehydrase